MESTLINIDRHQAEELLAKYVSNEKMISHSLASEAVMRQLAEKLNYDSEVWGLAGLLHDIDVEITNADSLIHGQKAIEILQGKVSNEIIDAIAMHNEISAGKPRETVFQHALAAGETITGLITATALVYPNRKVASVKVKSVVKRMTEKHFAASVKRENIMECEKIGIHLPEFVELALQAMTKISDKIGL